MSPEFRVSKRTFSRSIYNWQPEGVRQLSDTILQVLTHRDVLSDADLNAIRVAHRFVHDAGLGLLPLTGRVISTRDVVMVYRMVNGIYPDERELKRALGASQNVMNKLEDPRSKYELVEIEVERTSDFFRTLATSLNREKT